MSWRVRGQRCVCGLEYAPESVPVEFYGTSPLGLAEQHR
jgi:hypothetical protein